jgi:hypothetical protein
MSETQVPEVSIQALAEQVAALATQVEKLARRHEDHVEIADNLKHWIREFRECVSSRTGLPGGRGETGPAGKDAVVRVIESNGKIHVIDLNHQIIAELVPVEMSKEQATAVVKQVFEQPDSELRQAIKVAVAEHALESAKAHYSAKYGAR